MPVEISFGGTCRDIDLLPSDEAEFRQFFLNDVAPSIFDDFRKNYLMARGQGASVSRSFPGTLAQRGCEVGGSVSIRF